MVQVLFSQGRVRKEHAIYEVIIGVSNQAEAVTRSSPTIVFSWTTSAGPIPSMKLLQCSDIRPKCSRKGRHCERRVSMLGVRLSLEPSCSLGCLHAVHRVRFLFS